MSERIEDVIARAESNLEEIVAGGGDALQFGFDIGTLGRAVVAHPPHQPDIAAFAHRTAPLIARSVSELKDSVAWVHRVSYATESLSSDTELYVRALMMRSDLEFLREIYCDTVASSKIAEIDTAEMDANLQEWGRNQYLDSVPANIPSTHVWWHQSLSGI